MKTKFRLKVIALFLAFTLVYELVFPTVAFALTGGPSQPEVQGFEPIGTTEMVNLFSGDFVYNIPLLDVGGYPINLSYHAGIGMDQEASWVGLGWDLNPGAINRNMRGLPDDFSGDLVKKEMNMKPNRTWGLKPGLSWEVLGAGPNAEETNNKIRQKKPNTPFGVIYNNYRGLGFEAYFKDFGKKSGSPLTVGLGFNSFSGISVNPSLNFKFIIKEETLFSQNLSIATKTTVGGTVSLGYNSLAGLQSLSFAKSVDKWTDSYSESGPGSRSHSQLFSGTGGFSFGTPACVPQINFPTSNLSLGFDVTLGTDIYGYHAKLRLDGYYSTQFLAQKDKTKSMAGFGYIFSENGDGNDEALLDFNRENDLLPYFRGETPALPIPNFTYDVFSVSGQGTGGVFRPHRSDVGSLYDPAEKTEDVSIENFGMEIGFVPNLFRFGPNIKPSFTFSHSGKWKNEGDDKNLLEDIFKFRSSLGSSSIQDFEPAYFKAHGEMGAVDADYYWELHSDHAVHPVITKVGLNKFNLTNQFTNKDGVTLAGITDPYRTKRDKRTQFMTYLSAIEASAYGLETQIPVYPSNKSVFYSSAGNSIYYDNRQNAVASSHHLSEVTTTNPDGTRYVYGIPVYNKTQVEKTFDIGTAAGNIPNLDANCNTGLVTYEAESDNTPDNTKGISNFYSSTELPPYAHAYLLTAVLSADYIDVTGNGITDDDFGTAVKFNYTRLYPTQSAGGRGSNYYKWRVPLGETANQANYEEGFKTNPTDDKANYMYGEKEIYYLHSIESKNYLAEFITGDRFDALGVLDENGTIDNSRKLKRLKEIKLFSKKDRIHNGEKAVPIKSVVFEYSYKLCPNVPNNLGGTDDETPTNEGGKLTLERVYFTYGHSRKAQLNPYEFQYPDPATGKNPSYNFKAYDRWGNYKPNEGSCNISGPMPNAEFPYVDQYKKGTTSAYDLNQKYASAWNLEKIILPSGGSLNITYEADDYAYVQNERAMQMVQVLGCGQQPTGDPYGKYLFNGAIRGFLDGDNATNDLMPYIFFKLGENFPVYSTGKSQEELDKNYFDGMTNVFFRFLIDVTNSVNKTKEEYEYVNGYVDIEEYGVVPPSNTNTPATIGYIKLKMPEVGIQNSKVNPISKIAWHHIRQNMPEKIYSGSNPKASGDAGLDFSKSLVGMVQHFQTMVTGFYISMLTNGQASKFMPERSFIRLQNPTKCKYGGGARVKEIKLNDAWQSRMGEATDYDYGQTYEYKIDDGSTESSGVAEYEPLIGNDENPLRKPIYFDHKIPLAPDDKYLLEEPLGESFYPAPNVGYSRVKVQSLRRPLTGNKYRKSATGYIVHEFYTAKDFPVIHSATKLEPRHIGTKALASILSLYTLDITQASQGFAIELNNMHGKLKKTEVFSEPKDEGTKGTRISGIEYFYKSKPHAKGLQLDNVVNVINPSGVVEQKEIGKDVDFIMDVREAEDNTFSFGLHGNMENFLAGTIPAIIGTILASTTTFQSRFNSAVTAKVIHKYGVLVKTKVYDEGATTVTENVAFDSETGGVLLTKTGEELSPEKHRLKEWREPVYALNYPAHWAYETMSPAYENTRLKIKNIYVDNGFIGFASDPTSCSGLGPTSQPTITETNPTIAARLTPGDEVILKPRHHTYIGNVSTYLPEVYPFSWQSRYTPKNSLSRYWVHKYVDPNNNNQVQTILIARNGKRVDITPRIVSCEGNDFAFWNFDLEVVRSGKRNQQSASIGSIVSLDKPYDALGSPITFTNKRILEANAIEYSNKWSIYTCWQKYNPDGFVEDCSRYKPCDIVNPYVAAILGNNRVLTSYTYLADRYSSGDITSSGTRNNTLINKDGYYYFHNKGTQPAADVFWKPGSSGQKWTTDIGISFNPNNAATNTLWKSSAIVKKFSPYGDELETVDAIGRSSSAVYGYGNSLPIAVAGNSKYEQVAFDGFEDYDFYSGTVCLPAPHFNFMASVPRNSLSNVEKHSGNFSLKVNAGTYFDAYRSLSISPISPGMNGEYKLTENDIIGAFSPKAGKYVLSTWVKVSSTTTPASYTGADVKIILAGDNLSTIELTPKISSGKIVNGWQKWEYTFTITDPYTLPANKGTIRVRLMNNTGSQTAYFDDIRIHPYDATMKSFVYDFRNLRLIAELDENNYATFYEYDPEGNLIRVKKETYNGIMTLKEHRQNLSKKP